MDIQWVERNFYKTGHLQLQWTQVVSSISYSGSLHELRRSNGKTAVGNGIYCKLLHYMTLILVHT